MTQPEKSVVIDRFFERITTAEGYLTTARSDLLRLDLHMEAGTIEGILSKLRELSSAMVTYEKAQR